MKLFDILKTHPPRYRLLWMAAAVYGLIYFLSSRQASTSPDIAPDYVPHFIEYFILAYAFGRIFRPSMPWQALIPVFLMLVALAFLDELHQYYVPTRYFQLKDIIADSLGITAGLVCSRLRWKKIKSE
ncbi:MAG: VanZ family protein [bacterium]|nr:VanZ family protein [bacterium]